MKNIEEAKNYIAMAIEALREIPIGSKYYENHSVGSCIRELEDIQMLRL